MASGYSGTPLPKKLGIKEDHRLAILNAAMFIESAAVGLPPISFTGSLLSWAILATWWMRASGSVGTLASLAVLTGMTLVTLGGYAWAHARPASNEPAARTVPRFADGLFLGLTGHLFLLLLALNPAWAIPPWPLFGTLAVLTLAISVASLARSAGLSAGAIDRRRFLKLLIRPRAVARSASGISTEASFRSPMRADLRSSSMA